MKNIKQICAGIKKGEWDERQNSKNVKKVGGSKRKCSRVPGIKNLVVQTQP